MTRRDREFIKSRVSCPDIAVSHAAQGRIATTPISSSIVGALQVQEAIKVINKENEKIQMLEESFYFEGRSNTLLQRQYPTLKDNCVSHFQYDPIIESPLSCQMPVKKVLDWLSEHFGDEDPHIGLDNILVEEFTTRKSEITTKLVIPKPHLKGELIKKYQVVPGEELILTKRTLELDRQFEHQDMSLKACGIPPLHIIRVLTDDGEKYVELTGDSGFINFK